MSNSGSAFIIVMVLIALFAISYIIAKEINKGGGISTSISEGVEIVLNDGCEYFKNYVNGGYVLTHKGNCKNPQHLYNIERTTISIGGSK